MRNLLKSNLENMWFYVQKMDKDERKNTIKYIISLSTTKGGFIDYSAKFFMAQLIHNSTPYHNGKGTITKVKEFEKLGWYNEQGDLDFNKVYKR